MRQIKHVAALQYIRRLRGGSQPILISASDGNFYVIKFLDNFQGPNIPFNDALGTELFALAGLPVPEWNFVYLSNGFLDRNYESWVQREEGPRRPRAGWCFGSRFLSVGNCPLFEILPGSRFSRIRNRRDFWTAWVLDALCEHADNRQAIFVERKTRWLEAYFLDHGHLFGGADGTASPNLLASRFLDPRIYSEIGAEDIEDIQRTIQAIASKRLDDVVSSLPDEWKTPTALLRFQRCMQRISNPVLVKNMIHSMPGLVEHAKTNHGGCFEHTPLGLKRDYLYA